MSHKSFNNKLAKYTKEFFASHPDVKLVAVTGSAGKESAKNAIATVLSRQFAVGMSDAEPESFAQTLLQIMGIHYPDKPESKWNLLNRWQMIRAVKQRVRAEQTEVQVIVQEFNPLDIGYNASFQNILLPDITVVTSVTSGRMHVEHSLEEIAQEMITLANNSKSAVINRDDIDGRFAAFLTNPKISTYGTSSVAEYSFDEQEFDVATGHRGIIKAPELPKGLEVNLKLIGEHNIRPVVAAAFIGLRLGVGIDNIKAGLEDIDPLPGRMHLLRGANKTWLIDDSYSASPLTVMSALQTLYSIQAPQRIAVIGNLNGLRDKAPVEMAKLGEACSSAELDWVVTVGDKANQFLAPAARQRGCQVKRCADALEAGAFVRSKLHPGGIALFKGSSGGVWLEEAVKINLHSVDDEAKLVRQAPQWLKRKRQFFSRFKNNDAKIKNKQ